LFSSALWFSYATETSLARGNRSLASTCTAPTKIIMQMQAGIYWQPYNMLILKAGTEKGVS
jgi:hypothetical protein